MRERLVKLRKGRGLTQAQTAKKLGISRTFYGMIENGTRNPTLLLAAQIAEFYGTTMEKIFLENKDTKWIKKKKGR